MPQGKMLGLGWNEITEPKPVDTRTGDEIAADVISRLGLEVKA